MAGLSRLIGGFDFQGGSDLNCGDFHSPSHPLIGRACFYNEGGRSQHIMYAIPYAAYNLSDSEQSALRLNIAFYDPNSIAEGKNVHVKAMSNINPSDLIPLDPSSLAAQQAAHCILSWLIDNRKKD